MEFEEMQKIWDTQNRPLYVIDEQALHRRILAKKRRAGRVASYSEVLLIGVNILVGIFALLAPYDELRERISFYSAGVFMLLTAAYVLILRIRRRRVEAGFDNSIRGDLDHALANATYQVRLSQAMRWYILPVALFSLIGIGVTKWIAFLVLGAAFLFAYLAGGLEIRHYIKKKRELEQLHRTLTEEDSHRSS